MKIFKSPIFLISVLVIVMMVVGYKLKQYTAEEVASNIIKEVKIEFPQRPYDLHDVAFVAPATYVAVGSNGMILRSEDRGETWIEQSLELPGDNLLSVSFADDNHGWIVGTSTLIYRTVDGGKSWKPGYLGPTATCSPLLKCGETLLRRVYFLNDRVGWIAGEGPTLLNTKDAGKTWDAKDIGTDFVTLNDVAFFSPADGLVVGESGTICYTADGGETWTGVEGVTNQPLMRIQVIDDKKAIVVGLGGLLINTEDKGKTWKEIPVSNEKGPIENHLFDCAWLPAMGGPNDVMYVVGNGWVGGSFDLGRSWRSCNRIVHDDVRVAYQSILSLDFLDSCNGLIVGKNGVIAKTIDATTWKRVY